MNIDQKLLVWEATLARLEEAMATAEAEARYSSALEGHLCRRLADLKAEQADLDDSGEVFATTRDDGHGAP